MSILEYTKDLGARQNVYIRVVDAITGKVVQQHKGHNSATNSMLLGIAKYLAGYGTLNQAQDLLTQYVPKYISLGTMGLYSQNYYELGTEQLPIDIGGNHEDTETTKPERYKAYIDQTPGFGSDGYSASENNGRNYFGLGPTFPNRANQDTTVDCELISDSFPRTPIVYTEVVPETYAELPQTIDIVYSAMVSTGALKQFRPIKRDPETGDPVIDPETGEPKYEQYLFITEAGLWSSKAYSSSAENGLLAGYRIVPSDFTADTDMSDPAKQLELERSILRVGLNQVVQVVWKIQIGSITDINGGSLPDPATHWWILP